MTWPKIQIESWNQFTSIVDGLDTSEQYCFRGQANQSWKLIPTLTRRLPEGVTVIQARTIERKAIVDFFSQVDPYGWAHKYATGDSYRQSVQFWTTMQHYGAPTRLLDWSKSAFVAAYFAANECPAVPGAIWLFNYSGLRKHLNEEYEIKALFPAIPHDFEGWILSNYDEALSNGARFPGLALAKEPTKTDRMIMQRGEFTISIDVLADQADLISDILNTYNEKNLTQKLIIPAELKPIIIEELRKSDITAKSLFPGETESDDFSWRESIDQPCIKIWSMGPIKESTERLENSLCIAAEVGDEDEVCRLLDCGADVNIHSSWGDTALLAAARFGNEKIVELLLRVGADTMISQSESGNIPLIEAINRYNKEVVKIICQNMTNSPELDEALHYAMKRSNEHVTTLLDCGVDVNAISSETHRTPMMEAIARQSPPLLEILLNYGADINRPNLNGCTPLMLAVVFRSQEEVGWLIRAGANLNLRDCEGRTALSLAKYTENSKIVELLQDAGAIE